MFQHKGNSCTLTATDDAHENSLPLQHSCHAWKLDESSELNIHKGTVNGKPATVLRDTGCTCIGVHKKFVLQKDYTGKICSCKLFTGDIASVPTAMINITTPFISGRVEALVLDDPVVSLIIGNVIPANQASTYPDDDSAGSDDNGDDNNHKGKTPDRPPTTGTKQSHTSHGTHQRQNQPSSSQNKNRQAPADGGDKSHTQRSTFNIAAVSTRSSSKLEQEETDNNEDSKPHPLVERFDHEEFRNAQKSDPTLEDILRTARAGDGTYFMENGTVYRRKQKAGRTHKQLVVPQSYRRSILRAAHDSLSAGHLGITPTKKRILPRFTWPGIFSDIARYVRTCDACQRRSPKKPPIPLERMEIIEEPFKKVAVDIIGPLPMTAKKNRYVLTLVDYATRWPEAIPLKTITSEDVASALMGIFNRLGIPDEILSDNGQQFTSKMMADLMNFLGTTQRTSTPYHPQANGLCERFNGTLKSMIEKVTQENPTDWDAVIPYLLFAYREVPQSSTGYAPFELMLGRKVRGPMDLIYDACGGQISSPQFAYAYNYVHDLQETIKRTCADAQARREQKATTYKKYADRGSTLRSYAKGDSVLALLPTGGNSMMMSYQGPYKIIQVAQNNNYQLKVGNATRTYHANLLKRYHMRDTRDQCHSAFHMANLSLVQEDSDQHASESIDISTPTFVRKESCTDVQIDDQLSDVQRQEVLALLRQYADTLTDIPGQTSLLEHEIKVKDTSSFRVRHYDLPFHARDKITSELEQMLKMGIVRPSKSPYASPITAVKKADGSLRLCIDFRKLNSIADFDAEPIPNQEQLLTQVADARFFTKIDLTKGYWQIPLKESSKHFTAFQSPLGLLEFNFLPFGLAAASSTFQRLMRIVLYNIPNVISYFDDILVHGTTWEEHTKALSRTLQALQDAGLTARPTKTVVGSRQVDFLGHLIGHGKVQPNPAKVNKIKDLQPPKTKRDVRKLCGLISYYRKFVPHFAEIAQPLTDLTTKGKPTKVQWTRECEESFNTLKTALAQKPILALPDLRKSFIVRADASDKAIGAVLLQEYNGYLKPCQYISRKLSERETKYPIIEKECLAIVFALKKFSKYLLLKSFTIETDHKPLVFLKKNQTSNNRLLRWALSLQQFQFSISAISGNSNILSDLLSRY